MSVSSATTSPQPTREEQELCIENLISGIGNILTIERDVDSSVLPQSNKMATIPNFLKVHAETIPEFDGNENELFFFIESIDNVIAHFSDKVNVNNYQNNTYYISYDY